jgi:ATP-binding cassette subfamily C protein
MILFLRKLREQLLFIDSKSRKLLYFSIVLGICWFGLELSFVFILQGFLLSLKLIQPDKLRIPSWFPVGIFNSMIMLMSFGIIRAIVSYAKSFFSIVAMHSYIRHCRTALVNLGLDSKYFDSSSEFLTLFSERVNQSGIFVQYLSLGIVSFFSVLLFFAFGVSFAPKEMAFSLTFTVLLMIPVKKVTYKIQQVAESLIDEWNNINSNVLVAKRNMFFLAVYDLLTFKKNELKENVLRYEASYVSYASIDSLLAALPLLVGVSVLSICSYLSIEYFNTEGIKVLSFFYIFLRMTQGLSELNTTYAVLKLSYPSFRDVKKAILDLNILEEKEKLNQNKEAGSGFHLESVENNLELSFNDIAFGYPDDDFLFKNLSLNLHKGEVLVIKGPSGAGKSTLLKLILGLEKVSVGEIKINDHLVQDLDPSWRNHLGYVGPEPFLIQGTIRDNLHFGNLCIASLSDADCAVALAKAGLEQEFKQNNVTLDTSMAEISFFSTGQRQRLAIARAFLRTPSIMILDEATANLDAETERQIIKSIELLSGKMLTIIVTHKNSFDSVGTKFLNIGF